MEWEDRMAGQGGGRELATLGGGCFWCLEAVFQDLEGVLAVRSGYAGGSTPDPTYEQVCGGGTGHAEVVQVEFDPSAVSFREILEVFFAIHDPTTLNRQGADVGTQYRSAVFHHSPEQEDTVRRVIEELDVDGPWSDSIVTEVSPLKQFFPAEEYHADYYRRNPRQPYCQAVIDPKVAKFRARFEETGRGVTDSKTAGGSISEGARPGPGGASGATVPGQDSRASLLRRGRLLEILTLGWNSVEAVVAIGAGAAAGSTALIGFGVDSLIESTSGAVLLWRLSGEGGGEARESRALRLVGASFLLLATWVGFEAASSLLARESPDESIVGIGLAAVSLLVMPILARAKRKVAVSLGSKALEADSRQTDVCAYLSAILLVGLVLNALLGWWWADPVAALAMVPLIGTEGFRALRGEECADCHLDLPAE
jgi:peptide-methionine (S)-S-oxide reductase